MVNGYWENWRNPLNPQPGLNHTDPLYYVDAFGGNTHIFYSFLTLVKNAAAKPSPAKEHWDGSAIYDSYTAADILEVMKPPPSHNPYSQQRNKILAMMEACRLNK